MNKNIFGILSLIKTLASSQAAISFIGNPNPNLNDTGIFAYWNFNSLIIPTASAPGSGGVPTSISSDFGAATLSLSSWAGIVDDFGGDVLNAQNSDTAGASLSLVSSAGNNSFIQISFSMKDLKDLVINFAGRGTSSGFSGGQWSWSTDGTAFTSFGTSTATTGTSYLLRSPGTLTSLNDAPVAFLRYTLTGATQASGNNRIDNLTLTATSTIPEPSSSMLMLLGAGALIGVRAMKRRKD